MRLRVVSLIALIVAGSACRETISPERAPLVGDWITPSMSLGGGASYNVRYHFGADGSYWSRSTTYGSYGQAADAMTGFVRYDGGYAVQCDRLFLNPGLESTWDRFYGADSPVQVRQLPTPIEGISDLCGGGIEFTRLGDHLVFKYLSYPADAPVETTMLLDRVR